MDAEPLSPLQELEIFPIPLLQEIERRLSVVRRKFQDLAATAAQARHPDGDSFLVELQDIDEAERQLFPPASPQAEILTHFQVVLADVAKAYARVEGRQDPTEEDTQRAGKDLLLECEWFRWNVKITMARN
ncbi:MAG: hypothetical protein AAB728_04220 [Patescibacteria group bacterium]